MDVSVAHLLGQARERFANQDYYGAAHLLEEIVGAGRAFADVHHLLGLCRSLLGQHQRAVDEFDRALALNPRYIEAHIHRGIALSELGRVEEAETAFRQAAADHPQDWTPLNNLALALAEQKRFGEALKIAEQAVMLAGDRREARETLEEIRREAGKK